MHGAEPRTAVPPCRWHTVRDGDSPVGTAAPGCPTWGSNSIGGSSASPPCSETRTFARNRGGESRSTPCQTWCHACQPGVGTAAVPRYLSTGILRATGFGGWRYGAEPTPKWGERGNPAAGGGAGILGGETPRVGGTPGIGRSSGLEDRAPQEEGCHDRGDRSSRDSRSRGGLQEHRETQESGESHSQEGTPRTGGIPGA